MRLDEVKTGEERRGNGGDRRGGEGKGGEEREWKGRNRERGRRGGERREEEEREGKREGDERGREGEGEVGEEREERKGGIIRQRYYGTAVLRSAALRRYGNTALRIVTLVFRCKIFWRNVAELWHYGSYGSCGA